MLRGQLTVRGHSAPVELAVTESRASGDGLTLRGTTRIDRYAFGLTKKKGLAARYLDLEITAQATSGRPGRQRGRRCRGSRSSAAILETNRSPEPPDMY